MMMLTQEEFADMLGVSKSAVAKWETDGGIPERDNLKKLSEVMEVTVDELHRMIKCSSLRDIDFEINVTPEIISVLESHGYRIIRPVETDKNEK